MFCPNCGVRNLEDAKFCRACGTDIHLVQQAMTGHMLEGAFGVVEVEEQEKEGRKERKYKFKQPPTLEKGLENIFIGIAFFIIFLLGLFYFRGAFMLWVWLLIPALSGVGEGIGQIIRSRRGQSALPPAETFMPGVTATAPRQNELPAADTSEIIAPPDSITEGTTRRLGVPADRAAKDA